MPQQMPDAHQGDYWFNVVTKQVEVGPQSNWKELIGPYATREEAQAAPAKVAERNEAWEEQDED